MSKLYDKFQKFCNEKLLPVATKFGQNKIIISISSGLMYTLPLTLGASLFNILANFPIPAVNAWIVAMGLDVHFNAIIGGTLNAISLFMSVSIAYSYCKELGVKEANPIMAAFFSLASFLILMPQTINDVKAISYDYIGSSGMFMAIILGISITALYTKLIKNKRFVMKMPEGVPPMVSQSFAPLFVGLIILTLLAAIRIGLGMTPLNNAFNLIQVCIANPIMKVSSSVPTLIIITIVANGLFFFGIHPNAINTAIVPLLYTMLMTDINNYSAGLPLQYKDILVTNSFLNNDAVGSTLSLLAAVFIFCKSKRYRSMAKMMIVPNICNINEPVIFGFPIMLNPMLLIPFILSTPVSALIGYFASVTGFISTYNPIIALGLPWTTPKIVASFLSMGWQGALLRVVTFVVLMFIYLPFVKVLDKQELLKEKESEGKVISD